MDLQYIKVYLVEQISKIYFFIRTEVVAPAAPTRAGYTFAGWESEVPSTMPAEDMELTAQWEIDEYTITFDSAGGSTVAAITQDFGTEVVAPSAPTRAGYTFAGWEPEVPATMPAENERQHGAHEERKRACAAPMPAFPAESHRRNQTQNGNQ